jgi:hypothetical protein
MSLLWAEDSSLCRPLWSPNAPLPRLWIVWTSDQSPSPIPPEAARAREEEEKMARRKLTLDAQLKGVRAAIRSRRTPPQLRDGLRKRARVLQTTLAMRRKRKKLR